MSIVKKEDINKYYDKYKKKFYEPPVCIICNKIVYKDEEKEMSYNKRGGMIFIHRECWRQLWM